MATLNLLFTKFLAGHAKIIDLGCGTGTSLFLLSKIFPKAELFGCDWAPASQNIVSAIGRSVGSTVTGLSFDMKTARGQGSVPIGPDSEVVTIHSMEQLGTSFEPVLDMLLNSRPALVLHLEPLAELYDKENIFDQMAVTFHRQREYLDGYLSRVRSLATEGRVEILDERRLNFAVPGTRLIVCLFGGPSNVGKPDK